MVLSKKILIIVFSPFFLCLPLYANDGNITHKPWQLKGAEERIEKYRQGTAAIKLTLPDGAAVSDGTKVHIEQTRHAFNFGVSMTQLWSLGKKEAVGKYFQAAKEVFNYVTVGFYWAWHEKRQGKWRFRNNQILALEFAQANKMTTRGHPLMWHNTVPRWLQSIKSGLTLSNIVDNHITDLVRKYPQIDEWDTYNEAPSITKNYMNKDSAGRRYLMTNGGLLKGMHHVHQVAQAADKNGKFIINHHKITDDDYHELISYLLQKEVPIHAIGLQTHMFEKGDIRNESFYWDQMEKYAQYGIPIHLSEITILSSAHFDGWRDKQKWKKEHAKARRSGKTMTRPSSPAGKKFQADYLKDFYTLCFSHPAVDAMVYWNLSDFNFWMGSQGGLLDQENNPKPAYFVLKELVKNKWWTRDSARTENNTITFKGFYGSYKLTTRIDGKLYTADYDLNKTGAGKQAALMLKSMD